MNAGELRPTEKKEVKAVQPEETRGLLYFTPPVDIYENDESLVIVADMPGVEGKDVEIDLKDDVLTIQGRIRPFQHPGATPLWKEYEEGHYYRQFILSEIVDQERITAEMANGVLRLILPKVDRAKPRKIEVKSL